MIHLDSQKINLVRQSVHLSYQVVNTSKILLMSVSKTQSSAGIPYEDCLTAVYRGGRGDQ